MSDLFALRRYAFSRTISLVSHRYVDSERASDTHSCRVGSLALGEGGHTDRRGQVSPIALLSRGDPDRRTGDLACVRLGDRPIGSIEGEPPSLSLSLYDGDL